MRKKKNNSTPIYRVVQAKVPLHVAQINEEHQEQSESAAGYIRIRTSHRFKHKKIDGRFGRKFSDTTLEGKMHLSFSQGRTQRSIMVEADPQRAPGKEEAIDLGWRAQSSMPPRKANPIEGELASLQHGGFVGIRLSDFLSLM